MQKDLKFLLAANKGESTNGTLKKKKRPIFPVQLTITAVTKDNEWQDLA
jgi:hypothetical protein